MHRARRARDADPARRRLRRRAQGVGPLARRRATTSSRAPGWRAEPTPRRRAGAEPRVPRMARDKKPIPTCGCVGATTVGRLAAGQAVRQMGTRAANLDARRRASAGRAGAAPARDRRADRRRAGDDEGRGDEARPGHVASSTSASCPRSSARSSRPSSPSCATPRRRSPSRTCARSSSASTASRSSDVFATFDPRADRRRVDRPGLPRAPARRARRRGQGPVPRRRRGGPGRHAEPRDDPAADEVGRARARRRRRSREEIRSRIDEELDYELEAAQPARAVARLPRPPVHRRPGRRDVALPREGDRLRVRPGPRLRGGQAARRRTSATASARSSSASTSAACTATTSSRGDPHPGNCLLLDDGRMAFLDFGLFKRIRPEVAEFELQVQRLGIEGRRPGAPRPAARRAASSATPSHYTPDGIVEQFRDFTWWYTRRRGDPARARDRHPGDDRDERPALDLLREDAPRDAAARPPLRPPPGDAHAGGACRSCARSGNWHRIAREWIYGDAPVTELGRAEAGLPRRRGMSAALARLRLACAGRRCSRARRAARRCRARCRSTGCATGSTATAPPGRSCSSRCPRR